MTAGHVFRRLRGALGNALVWGVGWFTAAFGMFAALRLFGILPAAPFWEAYGEEAIKFGVVGGMAGGAFSSFIRWRYHGRRLSNISWVRFGIGGGVVTGLFVPAFIVVMRLLSGDPFLPLEALLSNGLVGAVFGGVAAGGSLKVAQFGDTLLPGKNQDQLDRSEGMDRLASAGEKDT